MSLRGWARRCGGFLLVAFLAYLSICGFMWADQTRIIFLPTPNIQTTPDHLGMKFETWRIPAGTGADQGELYSWWIPAGPFSGGRSLTRTQNAPDILFLHGNDANISFNLSSAQHLHELGFNVLMVDYRGYGKSTGGEPNEKKVYQDAEAAWQYLLEWRGERPQQTFIYGHSLGGAIAIDLAGHHPEAAGLIAESTFTSMADMGKLEYSFIPTSLLLNQRFDSLEKVSRLKVPVLFIHGAADKVIPCQMSQLLYAAAPQPKMLILIEGGDHENSSTIGWTQYRDAVSAFVKRYTH